LAFSSSQEISSIGCSLPAPGHRARSGRTVIGYSRHSRFSARFDDSDEDGIEERSVASQRLMRELLRSQRRALIELRNEGVIGDEVIHRIERDLDLEESRLEI
jgi:hypothetical protein